MRLLYDIFIRLYYLGIWIASSFNLKAEKWIKGRKSSFPKLKSFSEKNPKNLWIHCASVGEFEQGLPLIKRIKQEYPNYALLISFFSPSGYEYAKKKHPELEIVYLALDTKSNARKWFKILNPKAVFFIKYEFWHHYIYTSQQLKIPLYMVSAIFWKELFFFKKYGSFFRKSIRNVEHFFVQNKDSLKLLSSIGIESTTIIGDTRYERVLELKQSNFKDESIERFTQNKQAFIAGSVWNTDIPYLKTIIKLLPDNFRIIIAPHEINHFDYKKFENYSTSKYSQNLKEECKILFVDTIGILSKIYRFGSIAYIGGGFGKGIHNVLEPAVYNIPILIGANYKRFQEAVFLQENGLLHVLEQPDQLERTLAKALAIDSEIKQRNQIFFAKKSNVSEQILVFIKKHGILD